MTSVLSFSLIFRGMVTWPFWVILTALDISVPPYIFI
jgi:hypothetical protein